MARDHFPHPRQLEGRKEQPHPAPQSRDFFWDSISLYILFVILGLAAVDILFEFVRRPSVQCYGVSDTAKTLLANVYDYVTEYCSGRLPRLQLLPTFIAGHATLILVWHYMFFNVYGGDLDFFFRHVSNLVRTRDHSTGDYPTMNYVISQQLQEAFGRSNGMFWLYIFKIVMQFLACVAGAVIALTWLATEDELTVSFKCSPSDNKTVGNNETVGVNETVSNNERIGLNWPLPPLEEVICVFSPLRLLHNILGIYLFLLAVIVIIMVISLLGLVKGHTKELGFEQCAEFSFQTGIHYTYYRPEILSIVFTDNVKFAKKILWGEISKLPKEIQKEVKKMSGTQRFLKALSLFLWPFMPYGINSNYDFIMIRLFRTDGGLAYIMKELHILRLLKEKNRLDLVKTYIIQTNLIPLEEDQQSSTTVSIATSAGSTGQDTWLRRLCPCCFRSQQNSQQSPQSGTGGQAGAQSIGAEAQAGAQSISTTSPPNQQQDSTGSQESTGQNVLRRLCCGCLNRNQNATSGHQIFTPPSPPAGPTPEEEFLVSDIGWTLPDTLRRYHYCNKDNNYKPTLDKDLLTVPSSPRGVVVGCALRCEGGFEPTYTIEAIAERCKRMAEQERHILKAQSLCDKVKKFYEHEINLSGLNRTLTLKRKELLQREQQLEEAMQKMKKEMDWNDNIMKKYDATTREEMRREDGSEGKMTQSAASGGNKKLGSGGEGGEEGESTSEGSEASSGDGELGSGGEGGEGGESTSEGSEASSGDGELGSGGEGGEGGEGRESTSEGSEASSGDGELGCGGEGGEGDESTSRGDEGGMAGRDSKNGGGGAGESVRRKRSTNLIHELIKASENVKHQLLNQICKIRGDILKLEGEIKGIEKKIPEGKGETEKEILHELNNFESILLNIAYKKRKNCKQKLQRQNDEETKKSLLEALRQCGTSLIGALVIGFDMESEGLPSALARVFPRVGAINFSSHYGDYENPCKVLNSSEHFFNAMIPEGALAKENLVYEDLPEELKEKSKKIPVYDKALQHMFEVWMKDYIAKMNKDKREEIEEGRTDERHTQRVPMYKSNYIVIGPLKTDFHKILVNKILRRHDCCLARHVVILVLVPSEIGGKSTPFIEYRPPYDRYDEIEPNLRLTEECKWQPWGKTDYSAAAVPKSDSCDPVPFWIKVQHTGVKYRFKMYRRKEDE